jgi:hypothetical protein
MAGFADLQICHRYSNLSAHSNRQGTPTQGIRQSARAKMQRSGKWKSMYARKTR